MIPIKVIYIHSESLTMKQVHGGLQRCVLACLAFFDRIEMNLGSDNPFFGTSSCNLDVCHLI